MLIHRGEGVCVFNASFQFFMHSKTKVNQFAPHVSTDPDVVLRIKGDRTNVCSWHLKKAGVDKVHKTKCGPTMALLRTIIVFSLCYLGGSICECSFGWLFRTKK